MLVFKILVIVFLALILGSLAAGMFFLARDGGTDSRRLVTSLTIRVTLSISLFLLLFVGYLTGNIQPHGL